MLNADAIVNSLTRLVPERVRESSWMQPRYPLVGLELRDDAVIAVKLQGTGARLQLAGHAHRALPPGVLTTGLMKLQIGDARALIRAVQDALKLAGAEGAHKVSLALPDTIARVFIVDLQELPTNAQQAGEIIRLRLKKSVPFRLEDTRMSWQSLGRTDDGRTQVLVVLAAEAALRPVESLLEETGLRAGLIDIATFDLFNALRVDRGLMAHGRGDVAVLNATPGYFSTMMLRADRLIFYRSKNYHVHGGYQGEESLRVVGRELKTSLSYYHEHLLGEGVGLVLVRVSGLEVEPFLELARQSISAEVRAVQAAESLPGADSVRSDQLSALLPALGLVMRRQA
jgi:hypothetical protein